MIVIQIEKKKKEYFLKEVLLTPDSATVVFWVVSVAN